MEVDTGQEITHIIPDIKTTMEEKINFGEKLLMSLCSGH